VRHLRQANQLLALANVNPFVISNDVQKKPLTSSQPRLALVARRSFFPTASFLLNMDWMPALHYNNNSLLQRHSVLLVGEFWSYFETLPDQKWKLLLQ
jgi:hypothetical protein